MLKETSTFDHVIHLQGQKFFGKIATIVVAIATIVVGVATIVVDCNNCDHIKAVKVCH